MIFYSVIFSRYRICIFMCVSDLSFCCCPSFFPSSYIICLPLCHIFCFCIPVKYYSLESSERRMEEAEKMDHDLKKTEMFREDGNRSLSFSMRSQVKKNTIKGWRRESKRTKELKKLEKNCKEKTREVHRDICSWEKSEEEMEEEMEGKQEMERILMEKNTETYLIEYIYFFQFPSSFFSTSDTILWSLSRKDIERKNRHTPNTYSCPLKHKGKRRVWKETSRHEGFWISRLSKVFILKGLRGRC